MLSARQSPRADPDSYRYPCRGGRGHRLPSFRRRGPGHRERDHAAVTALCPSGATDCLRGRRRCCRELLNHSSERVSGCPLVTVRYPDCWPIGHVTGTSSAQLRSLCAAPLPRRTDCCRSIRRRRGVKGRFACTFARHFTCARCPAVRSGLDAGPEAYDNRWQSGGGPVAPSPVIRRGPSPPVSP